MGRVSRLAVAVLVAAMGLGGSSAPAGAVSTAGVQLVGTGTFSPGIDVSSPPQTVTFGATGAGAHVVSNSPSAATVSCSFNAYEVNSSATFSGSCHGALFGFVSLSCTFASQRLVLVWVWNGSCGSIPMRGVIAIIPTSVRPITSFAIVGVLTPTTAAA